MFPGHFLRGCRDRQPNRNGRHTHLECGRDRLCGNLNHPDRKCQCVQRRYAPDLPVVVTYSGTISGATQSTYTTAAEANGDTYACTVTTACGTAATSGSLTMTVEPLPTVFNVTGGGAYCSGGSGVVMGLDGSASGFKYGLYLGSTALSGAGVSGTGSAISFGSQTTAGTTYTVWATNSTTGCIAEMNGTATVTVNTSPVGGTATPGSGTICTGTGGRPSLSRVTLAASSGYYLERWRQFPQQHWGATERNLQHAEFVGHHLLSRQSEQFQLRLGGIPRWRRWPSHPVRRRLRSIPRLSGRFARQAANLSV